MYRPFQEDYQQLQRFNTSCSAHSPLLSNLAVTRARVTADDPLWVLHGLDRPKTVVLEMVTVDLMIVGGIGKIGFTGLAEQHSSLQELRRSNLS